MPREVFSPSSCAEKKVLAKSSSFPVFFKYANFGHAQYRLANQTRRKEGGKVMLVAQKGPGCQAAIYFSQRLGLSSLRNSGTKEPNSIKTCIVYQKERANSHICSACNYARAVYTKPVQFAHPLATLPRFSPVNIGQQQQHQQTFVPFGRATRTRPAPAAAAERKAQPRGLRLQLRGRAGPRGGRRLRSSRRRRTTTGTGGGKGRWVPQVTVPSQQSMEQGGEARPARMAGKDQSTVPT